MKNTLLSECTTLFANQNNKKNTTRFNGLLTLFIMVMGMGVSWGQTAVPMSSQVGLTYTENFSDIANWTNNFAAGTGASRWASYPTTAGGSANDGVRTTKTSATFVSGFAGGVQKGTGNLIFLSTGSTAPSEAVAVDFLLNFTGVNAGSLSFDWAAIDNSNGTRPTSLRVYWSTNNSIFTEINSAQILNVQSANSGSISTIALPAAFNNSATARLRFYNHAGDSSGSGNRDKISIDNITVTATSSSTPAITISTASLTNFSQTSSTPSTEQTYNVSGDNLNANVVITPPTGFEISTSTGGSFSSTNPITLNVSGGNIVNEPVTIYVRQVATALGPISGNIIHDSNGATQVNLAVSGARTENYYSKSIGDLNNLNTWGLNADGSGGNPANFSTGGVVYNIANRATVSIGANWVVSGAASRIVVGDGTNATDFTIPSGFTLTGTIDISNAAELTIENTTAPTFGTFAANSTLEYNNLDVTLSTAITYRNLKLTGTGTKVFPVNTTTIIGNLTFNNTSINGANSSPFSSILLTGNLTYVGTVTPPTDANSITLSTNGTAAGTQTFTGAGNTLRWFRITTTTANTIVLSTTGGSSNVLLGNAAGGGLTLVNDSILNMNGNDFQLFSGGASFVLNSTGSISTNSNTDFNLVKTTSVNLGTIRFTTGSNTIGNLTLNHTGTTNNTLTIQNALNVNGVITVTDGTLASDGNITLKSSANGTAQVAAIGTGGAITGNVTVERFIPAKRAWRALTAPVNTTNSIFANWQENGANSGAGNGVNGFDIWMPAGGNGLTAGGSSNSLLEYNSASNTWTGITATNGSNSMMNGNKNKPFMAFVTGPYGSGNISSNSAATTLRATGSLFTGNQSYTTTAGKYTFIGNPYASPLDLSVMMNTSENATASFEGNVWVWDANASGLNAVGTYNLYTSGTYTNLTSNPVVSAGTQIQSGQAFFVKSTDGAPFTIKEAHKGSTFSNAVFRTGALPELLRVGLYKQVNNEWSGRDGAMTVILSNVDANQASNKMANGTENIAFTKNGASFASNYHLPLVASDVLNVKVWNTTSGSTYKLKINTEEFAATNLEATLEDLFTNSRTPLTLDGSSVEYPFTVTSEALSTGDRFRIVFQSSQLNNNIPKFNGFSIVPNPVTGDSFQVNLGSLATGTYSYSICNTIGQEVEKGTIQNAAQNTNYEVKMNNSATGIYIMKIKGNDNSVFTAKIIKK